MLLLKKAQRDRYSLGLLFYLLIRKENKIENISGIIEKILKYDVESKYHILYLSAVINYFDKETKYPNNARFNRYYTEHVTRKIDFAFSDLNVHKSLIEKGLMFLAFEERENTTKI